MSNEITAYFKGTSGVSESVYQFDYGMILIIDGPDLTAPFEVHFEHTGGVDAVTAIGQDNRVAIPNACLALPGRVTAYIYDHTGQHDGQTAYVVRFQVMNRARPVDEVTDEQDSAISKAIALLAEPIDNIETIVNEALAKTGTTLHQLEEQFNTAIHAVTTSTEVTDIRVGDDGVTYNTAGQAVRTQFSNLKSAFIAGENGYYIVKPPETVALSVFKPQTGNFSSAPNRVTYVTGVSLHGAKGVRIEIQAGYQWVVHFANVNGQYTYISSYPSGNQWKSDGSFFVEVPDGANRMYINCKKTDNSDISASVVLGIFNVWLIKPEEKEVYEYDDSTSFTSQYYGNYQYVIPTPNANEWARLTQDRFYHINKNNILRIKPVNGYSCVINFFDADFRRLGNNGAWITGDTYIDLKSFYQSSEYFKISYKGSENETLTSNNYNMFSVSDTHMQNIIPSANIAKMTFVKSYSVNTSDIAVYNDTIVIADTGYLMINDTRVDVEVGHGNNIMFGTSLYNDFPKLYSGGWYTWNKCVYVIGITDNSATLIDTITFDALPDGFINACVDDKNERIYIFEETGADTYQGNILFAVADFDGNIITQKP